MRTAPLINILHSCFWTAAVGCAVSCRITAWADDDQWPAAQIDHFERQVRPLLIANCWSCHGDKKQEGGLRLDTRAAVLHGGDNGPAVFVGHAAASRLMQAVRYVGDTQMPPSGPLKPDAIAALERWINSGMAWPKSSVTSADAWKLHWAFQPIRKPALRFDPHDGWSRTQADSHVHAALRSHNLSPSVTAERRTLLRRVTFDLWGLPPTPADIAEFDQDESPDAWDRLLDRLLASPKYGERWGRHWLDVARYSDTKGYVFFEDREFPWGYTYRDYVIEALNADLPYDRFLLEQFAADQLDLAGDSKPLRAMGYLTLGPRFMNNLHDILDDRIDVATRGVMGLTVTCARCHDHKYDPVSQADYYALYGVFRSSTEPLILPEFASQPHTQETRTFAVELAKRKTPLDEFIDGKHAAVVNGARARVAEYLIAARNASRAPAMDDFMLITDPGEINPAVTLRWQAYLEKVAGRPHPVWTPWVLLSQIPDDQFAARAAAVLKTLRAPLVDGRLVNSRVLQSVLEPPPESIGELAQRYGTVLKSIHEKWETTLVMEAALKHPAPTAFADGAEEELRQELYGPQSPASVPKLMGWGFLTLLPDRASQAEFQKLLQDVETWLKTGVGAPPRANVLLDSQLYEPKIFERGNPNRLGPAVPRRFLGALDGDAKPFTHGSGRLELAAAIASPQNPLTARVLVNRTWMHHFGVGLVRTPGDFGVRSDPPTHPELLDHLAAEFLRHRWSWKWLQRSILSSAVYQQVSTDRSACVAADPDNTQLWKMNRRRLDLESTRDALIAVANHLNDQLYGPSQPLFDGGFHPRRSVYNYLDRQDPPGLMTVFDFPNASVTNPQRDTTTVSPQALYFMNGPLTETAARFVVSRLELTSARNLPEEMDRLTMLLFARQAAADELMAARNYLGDTPSSDRWQHFVEALLMTNEFVFVD